MPRPPLLGPVAIEDVRPRTPGALYPAKAVVGEVVTVSADIFKDGHDVLAAQVRYRPVGGRHWTASFMRLVDNHRWSGTISPQSLGLHEFEVEAWTDPYLTWRRDVLVKHGAGQDVSLELEEGALLIESTVKRLEVELSFQLDDAVAALRNSLLPFTSRLAVIETAAVQELFRLSPNRFDLSKSGPMPLWVDRQRALTGAWYELFPRSTGGFKGTIEQLPRLVEMGFDVLYLPPVHPIGRSHRKGRNNSVTAVPGDVGSPWAIGADVGGHTSIDANLGTLSDFDALVKAAEEAGIEIALDYALQCSPDHPWVKHHPEWFYRRPDGTIGYAENPPKKYQDIYPINFWPPGTARQELWNACKQILDFWIRHGVRIFRVDNPHTKPLAFWAWLIQAVQSVNPDVIFLAEAFTHPKMMAKLAEVGFSQSYTYFTWRVSRQELTEYATEVAHGPASDYMRPNFWPNTPDILSGPLRLGGPPEFRLRLVLAATLSPSYGIYSGYELCENEPARETDEEYLNSEKYEVKKRNFAAPGNLSGFIARINRIRREHPGLQQLRNLHFHSAQNNDLLVYSKATRELNDVVLVIVNLDATQSQSGTLGLDLARLGMDSARPYLAEDLLTGTRYEWNGSNPWVRLDPQHQPAHILALTQLPAG
ncbi:MAG: alpha-1,4-glucan--maltose-1-phosphate maltosyltransferase [Actinomycetota bacterium]